MCSFAEEPILHVISVSKFGPSCFYFLRVLQTHTSLFSLHGELACRTGFRSEMEALCMQTCFGCRFCRMRPRSLIYISTCIFPPKCVVWKHFNRAFKNAQRKKEVLHTKRGNSCRSSWQHTNHFVLRPSNSSSAQLKWCINYSKHSMDRKLFCRPF